MPQDILIVDDEADICHLISDILEDHAYLARSARNSDEAFEQIARALPDAIILDIWLKNSHLDGLGILETVKRKYPSIPVVVISGHGTVETAITSLKMGAYDYLEKPFSEERMLHVLSRSIENTQLLHENEQLRSKDEQRVILMGHSPAMQQLRHAVKRVASTGSRVFMTGPAGVGKLLIAQTIHQASPRHAERFVAIHMHSLEPDAVAPALFGTEENTDINAPARVVGALEQAHGGTLFIDDVTAMPQAEQSQLLRFLQHQHFKRIGGERNIEVDVRVIAATSVDPQEAIQSGQLREDLYYRLSVVPLHVPHVKERKEDIPELSDYFLDQAARQARLPRQVLAENTLAALQAYDWPGNIDQLRNMMEWVTIMYADQGGKEVTTDMLPQEIFAATPAAVTPEVNTDIMSMKLRPAREIFERQYLTAQINRFGGNISRTANFIGMERSALHRKLKSLNIHSDADMEVAEEA